MYASACPGQAMYRSTSISEFHPRQASGLHLADGALPIPPERMDARVGDQPARPLGLRLEHPETFVSVDEQTELVRDALAVQAPALDERVAGHEAAEAPERQ